MYKNILIPVIFDQEHDTNAAFLVAKTLAGKGAKVTVMHVMDHVPAYVASQIPPDVMAKSRSEVEHKLAELARGAEGATTVLAVGNPGRQIVDYAAENGIDCIVLASHKPGLENLLIGSTAYRVVRHAKCAVHVIR